MENKLLQLEEKYTKLEEKYTKLEDENKVLQDTIFQAHEKIKQFETLQIKKQPKSIKDFFGKTS